MKTNWVQKKLSYDGSQLRSLFGYLDHGVLGDSIIGFRGACDIPFENMIDGEDLLEKAAIRGGDMVHFIVEKFDEKLSTGVALQRLLASIVKDYIEEERANLRGKLRRQGDDIYWGRKKLSISIATASPVSVMVHFAVNVTNEGTPVPTVSLKDLRISPEIFGREILSRFSKEILSLDEATQKVRHL